MEGVALNDWKKNMRDRDRQSDDKDIEESAVVVSERELWLHKSPKAKKAVSKGLEQAKKGKIRKNAIDLNAYEE